MSPTVKKLPSPTSYPENISILLVSPNPADLPALRAILHHAHWDLRQVDTAEQAARHIQRNAPSLLICERDLPDGTWKDVLWCISASAVSSSLLVASRRADEALWAEVLNLGGYDVLLKPFDKSEVVRVVGMAWRHWWNRYLHRAAGRAAAMQRTA